jgi:prolyl-tRNA synthetase
MYQSKLFSKTRKEAPKDEVSKNAELLIKAGFINKEMAGVYSYLPLGLRVLNNINKIIREEMNRLGSQEVFLTSLQEKENWEKTNRWSDEVVDNWFKTKLKNETELGLAFTHEEALTSLMKNHVRSYKDLPFSAYQIQTKFRNEARAKSGIMRCREFLMKDMYSFSRDEKEHLVFYEKAKQAYVTVFKRVGLGEKTHLTFASGGSFCKYSHEFQTAADTGEDLIYYSAKNKIAINKEVLNAEVLGDLKLEQKDLQELKAVEVGNIFTLGIKFSEPLGLVYLDEAGEKKPVFMGSYGIGPGRVMGAVVESLADDKGIVWPVEIAPFKVHLIEIGTSEDVKKAAQDLYSELQKAEVEVLYDDRDLRPGEKFADSDLLGIPLRIIVSEKTLISGEYEIKERALGQVNMVKEIEVVNFVKKYK